jgi:LysM repeat protein
VGLTVGAVLAISAATWRAGNGAPEPAASRIYVVKPGDTIWSIVRMQSGAREDPRSLVDRVIRVNRLRGALIRPGQRIILPS